MPQGYLKDGRPIGCLNKGMKRTKEQKLRMKKARNRPEVIAKIKANRKRQFGENAPMWKGGRFKMSGGYILIYAPEHPYAFKGGGSSITKYIREHRLVMEKKLGRYLAKDEIVHHINGIRDDNRPENLYIVKGEKMHKKIENHLDLEFICPHCKKDFKIKRYPRSKFFKGKG